MMLDVRLEGVCDELCSQRPHKCTDAATLKCSCEASFALACHKTHYLAPFSNSLQANLTPALAMLR